MRLFLFLLIVAPSVALAQAGLKSSDIVLNQSEMSELLSGTQLEFFDGSKSKYAADGSYAYTYTDDGPPWTGLYRVLDGSVVCVDFDNGSARCDRLVRSGDRMVLIIEDGTRFPVRNLTVYNN